MNSPRPKTSSDIISSFISSADITKPESSRFVAGTQEGIIYFISSAVFSAAFCIYEKPLSPHTFTISCGSAITVVVPCGTTIFPNSSGVVYEDSICICASISPGEIYFPVTSISLSPSYSPKPAISPFAIAKSAFNIFPPHKSTMLPFLSTRSAFFLPAATSISFFKSSFSIIPPP